MKIKTTPLSDTPLSEITRCFNEAFSDYFVKFNATEEYLRTRWKGARVDYNLSFGYFVDGHMRGFIMHGIDFHEGRLTAFNCATGIEPPYRGKGILGEIYKTAIAALKKHGVQSSLLEVISINKKAIRAYEKTGFKIRNGLLHCFKNQPKINIETNKEIKFYKTKNPDYKKYKPFRDYAPTWEMTSKAFAVFPGEFDFWEMKLKDELIGYLIIAPKTGLVQQFAINKKYRKKGFGKMLFQNTVNNYENIRVNNVPESAEATVGFLKSTGMENHIDQYEMVM
ncbi:MAG TPA: GNAT family N-acetyltransferase [Bacteroidetes bacterium]|nr:GNAT family N-acetyltransferase [Bacteroidota bacterium]